MDTRLKIPHSSFIGEYIAAQAETETALAYDFWCAVWALSTVIGRRIYVDRPRAPVYLNWYMVLVAESGITRKSTAVNNARNLVYDIIANDTVMIEGSVTPDKLQQDMSFQSMEKGHAHTTICVPEMVTVFGRERHTMSLPGVLTDLYDSPSRRSGGGTLSRSAHEMRNVFVSLLSASTPSWLLRAINPDIVEGGFTSRTIFVMAANPKRRIAWPSDSTSSDRTNLQARLRKIRDDAEIHSRLVINKAGLRRFRQWYNARELVQDAYVGSFQSREDAHVLRLAAVLCINDGSWEIQVRHISLAIKLITEVRDSAASLFTGVAAPSNLLQGIDKVRTILADAGQSGIRQPDLFNRVRRYIKSQDLANLMDIMHELGMVRKLQTLATENAKRPRVIWVAADLYDVEKFRSLQESVIGP